MVKSKKKVNYKFIELNILWFTNILKFVLFPWNKSYYLYPALGKYALLILSAPGQSLDVRIWRLKTGPSLKELESIMTVV